MSWSPQALLAPPAAPLVADRAAWTTALAELEPAGPVALAVLGGHRAASVGWAFSFGYQAALRALLPEQTTGRMAALCATEAAGNHPRSIETTLHDGVLTGDKTFVSLGPWANLLVVVATQGQDERGRNRLVACIVEPGSPGVTVDALAPLPVVPDVPHGRLALRGARPREVLAGDGYAAVLKPFRTVEDIHVHAALAAWLLRIAGQSGWPPDIAESLLVGLSALSHAARLDPTARGTHRLLGGALADLGALVDRLEPLWAHAPPHVAAMWTRDRALLGIAHRARERRLHTARQPPRAGDSHG